MQPPNILPAAEGPTLAHLASRVLNRPLLLHPDKAAIVLHVLQGRIGVEQVAPISPDANRFMGSRIGEDGRKRTYSIVGGVATIPIVGSLVNRGAWIGASSGLVSYEGLSKQLSDAAADPEVSAILLDIDSPGGEASGMFTLAAQIAQVTQTMPVTALVNDMAASAAYGLASAASEIVVSPTSIVGSVGVVLTHLDRSGEMERKGVRATLIHAGRHKVDGHPFGPLSEAVHADLQAEVTKVHDQFVSLVAANRPGMTDHDVRATEARTYLGQDAIDVGLADRIATLDAVLAELSKPARGATSTRRGFAMSKPTETAPMAIAGISQADHDAAVEVARAEGMRAGQTEATARIRSILGCEDAKGREAQAMVLALDTAMNAEDAAKVLAASPKAPSGVASIAERAAGQAEMGADAGSTRIDATERVASGWARAIANANQRFA
ncbi:S49 family peptidase [Aquibium sp. ELW1220]|uniref:S49 family peptidase n=1 Tax=Aquibium sp. ELW1220 TaxID=2976766 RepID=UPI0025B091B2|nr:S49 family peptidase [Aquibium sp. ELW1220]MDN2578931.1 S49 family peptidase [Aquibium sp. ELW1220]